MEHQCNKLISEKKEICVILAFLDSLLLIFPVLDRRIFCLRLMTDIFLIDIP